MRAWLLPLLLLSGPALAQPIIVPLQRQQAPEPPPPPPSPVPTAPPQAGATQPGGAVVVVPSAPNQTVLPAPQAAPRAPQ